ncbi:hypothetical protein Tco_0743314 [Tanacetum coccineum]
MLSKFVTSNTASTSGTLPSNTVTNPKEDLKGITTRSGVAYKGPTIPILMEHEPEVTKDTMPPTNNGSPEDVQPLVVPVVHHESISEPVNAPVSASMPNQKASILFPTRRNDERRHVYEGEITLRVGRKVITFNLDQTSRYTANYNHMTGNRIDFIDMACEEYSQEVLGFSNVISSGNPTPYYDPIVSTSSPTLTPFGDSDFLLFEEADYFLAIEDDPTSPEVDPIYYDPDGDILLLKAILNSDPSPPPNQGNYFPETRKDLKIYKANNEKSSVNEPPENEEKAALIEVLKSYKRAIAWKLSDIKEFDVIIRDKKEAENLAADHLSRLENPHKDKLGEKPVTLVTVERKRALLCETLGSVALFVLDSTPWLQILQTTIRGISIVQGNVHPTEKQVFK